MDRYSNDSDGDSIPDGIDVEGLQSLIQRLPNSAVKSRTKATLLRKLEKAEKYLEEGEFSKAAEVFSRVREDMDGCGHTPDEEDGIIDCRAQDRIRHFLDIVIGNLQE